VQLQLGEKSHTSDIVHVRSDNTTKIKLSDMSILNLTAADGKTSLPVALIEVVLHYFVTSY
jgi:hypothetical protein